MISVSENMIKQLLSAGIPIVGELAKLMDIPGSDIIDFIKQGKISETSTAKAIAQYVNELIIRYNT